MIKVNYRALCLLLSQSFLSLFPTPLRQPSTRGTDLFVTRKNCSGSLQFFQDTTLLLCRSLNIIHKVEALVLQQTM